jgi:predicted dehydrogenase
MTGVEDNVEADPMAKRSRSNTGGAVSRRDFVRGSAAALTSAMIGPAAFAQGTDRIRVGLIGCGGRGTDAARNCVHAAPGIEIAAMGDLFADRLNWSRGKLREDLGDAMKATDGTCFSGFDAYRKVIGSGVDMVILATPPHFRPEHYAAAVEAGKHVFMEKPVAVDPVGARAVMEASDAAAERGLGVVAGTQRRHQKSYREVVRRIRDGAIGELVAAQCYWNQEGLWVHRRQPHYSDVEWQIRNWLYFTWVSGDHIVEQHVHNIDIINWAFGGPPVKAMGMGGRQVRTGPEYGNVYDHFAVEYEYANGARVLSTCRQIDGTSHRIGEHVVGTKGTSNPGYGYWGESTFEFKEQSPDPYVQEHADLIAGIRAGEPPNEGRQVAESTLTAIMGRMSAYTGREVQWSWIMGASKLRLGPTEYEFGDFAAEPVAQPGKTPLV